MTRSPSQARPTTAIPDRESLRSNGIPDAFDLNLARQEMRRRIPSPMTLATADRLLIDAAEADAALLLDVREQADLAQHPRRSVLVLTLPLTKGGEHETR